MRRAILAAAALAGGCASLIFAQNSETPAGQQPISVKRQAPAAAKKGDPAAVPPALQKYDFGAQLQALQNVDGSPGAPPGAGATPADGKYRRTSGPKLTFHSAQRQSRPSA